MNIKSNKLSRVISGLLLIIIILLGLVWFLGQRNNILEFVALDIGQGDAILIKTPYHQNVLIDGGSDNSVIYRLSKNLPFYDRTIDLMILTHPDIDHVTGLVEVLKRYQVKKVLYNGLLDPSPNYLEWLALIDKKNISKEIGQDGVKINLGQDLELEILYPKESYLNQKVEDTNITSIIAKLIYRNTSFMLTGDAPIEAEKELIDKQIDLKADVLKVSHHGSKTATSEEFLSAVEPIYAIISVGKNNSFGHPSLRTLKTLKEVGAKILRTDELGDVVLVSDGTDIKI